MKLISSEGKEHYTNPYLANDGSRIGADHRWKYSPVALNSQGKYTFSTSHMSARDIRNLIGKNFFESSLVVSSVRRPYERDISHFHWRKHSSVRDCLIAKREGNISWIRQKFKDYLLQKKGQYTYTKHLKIDNEIVVDKYIRQEFLKADLSEVLRNINCSALDARLILNNIGDKPTGSRKQRSQFGLTLADYLDQQSLDIINKRHYWVFPLVGYNMIESIRDLIGQI